MNDLVRFETALKAAADAGDVEGARSLATEMRRIMARSDTNFGLPRPVKLGQEGMSDSIKAVAKDEGVATQRLAGLGSAPMVAGHAVAELAGANNAPDSQNWKAVAGATPDTTFGNVAGNALLYGMGPTQSIGPTASVFGAKTLPRAGQVADMAATQGGIAATTTPGDAGDRLVAGLTGVAGAAIPGGVATVQMGRRQGPLATIPGRQLDVAESLRRELGPDADALVAALQGKTYPTSSIGVRPSAAMLTNNPTLAVMETGSRVRTGDQWQNFDKMNAAARWKALEDAAGTPEELAKMKAARDVLTGPMRETALHNAQLSANPLTGGAVNVQGADIAPLRAKLTELATGSQRPNAAVQTMVGYVGKELEKGVTPEQLYTIRKSLTDGIAAAPTSELSQAARAARPQRMELIGLIDKTLDEMSGGGWNQYLQAYKIESPNISSKQSLQKIRDALIAGRPAGEVPASMGEKAAPYTFGRLLDRHGEKMFGSQNFDQLTPAHRDLAEALLTDLNRQQSVMLPRGTLGSPTAPYLANAGRVNQVTNSVVDAAGNVIPLFGNPVAASVKGNMARQSEEALANMLQNPDVLAKALQDAARAQAILNMSGRGGAAVGGARRGMSE